MEALLIAAADGVEIRLQPAGPARRCFAAAVVERSEHRALTSSTASP